MKLFKRAKLAGGLLAGLLLAFGTMGAQAAETAVNTDIGNTVTLDYKVGGADQTAKTSTVTFKVGARLALTVEKVDTALVPGAPNQPNVVLTYKVTNTGNDTQGVTFATATNAATATADPFGGAATDSFDVSAFAVHVSKIGLNAGTAPSYVPLDDTTNTVSQLAPGGFQYVFVLATLPQDTVVSNGDIAVVNLIAQVAEPGADASYATGAGTTIGSDDSALPWFADHNNLPSGRDYYRVFADAAAGPADAAYDGKASAADAYVVAAAALSIAKTAVVVSDPICTARNTATPGSCANPKAIPGAVMEYTITVTNAANAAQGATAIALSDDLSAQIGTSLAWTGPLTLTAPGLAGSPVACVDNSATPTVTSQTTTVGGSAAGTCGFDPGTGIVTVTGLALDTAASDQVATLVFKVTIN
jgi:hypothetical protein